MLVLNSRKRGYMNKFAKLYISWFKIGLFTFGGGYAMIPMIQKEVVDKHHWVTAEDVLNYYAISQCTPGAIAVNLSTFIGGKIDGFLGALAATLGVISPSIIIISIIATFLSNFSSLDVVKHALAGIQIAVCVLMFGAVKNLFKTSVVDIQLNYLSCGILTSVFYRYSNGTACNTSCCVWLCILYIQK